ncbi:MAG TPA: hypothetical protein DCY94_01570 [Firmicutes bacterium]|nr:hypothetical protein [Bacillota bacterium]
MDDEEKINGEQERKDVAGLDKKEEATSFGMPFGGFIASKFGTSKLGSGIASKINGNLGRGGVRGLPNAPVGFSSSESSEGEVSTEDASTSVSNQDSDDIQSISPTGEDESSGETNDDGEKKFKIIGAKFKDWPLKYKLIAAGVIAGTVLVIIIFAAFLGMMPINFLDYSNDAEGSQSIQTEYEKWWQEFCSEDNDNCTPEQMEAALELQESQRKFFERLDKLVTKEKLSNTQKYMVLTTIFLGYDIDDFTEGNKAFEVVGDENIEYATEKNISEDNIYIRELDTLKELIKQFKIDAAICTYDQILENGEIASDQKEPLRNLNTNNTFVFSFFERIELAMGLKTPDGWNEAYQLCTSRPNGRVSIDSSLKDENISIEGFYNYLRNSDFLDTRPQLSSYFSEYAKNNHLSMDTTTWANEDLIAVRESIIKDIKSIVEEYIEEKGPEFNKPSGRAYWWPIGSAETTEKDGVEFASDDPQFTQINSPYGTRTHPVTGEKLSFHNGIDLHGVMGETNVIASLGGVVIQTNDTCVSRSVTDEQMACGGRYGNFVQIQDTKGNITIYAHLYRGSITVQKNDIVEQGQVIGKVGSSGRSTGAHLHFTLMVNGAPVNPLEYVDPEDPRPTGASTIDFNKSSYTREEFVSRLETYYSTKKCNTSGCESFKDQIVNHGGAGIIYDVGTRRNLNPELLIGRTEKEGFSPGTAYNYFGYGCTNTGGLAACYKFTSFEAGIEEFFTFISKFDSVEGMMSKYAYLGDYWYTVAYTNNGNINWGIGGCAYANYIYPDGIPDRVSSACNVPTGTCTTQSTAKCVPTTQEDRELYTKWQVSGMETVIKGIFG